MASINDKLRKYKSLFSTTLSTGIGTGTSDTITPATVTGLPTDTAITLTIDRVDSSGIATPSKLERIKGIISGGNLIDYVRGVDGTTEQSHTAGAVVEMVWNAADLNDIVDWGLVQHGQDGVHSSALVTSLKASGAVVNTGTSDVTIVTPKALADSDYFKTSDSATLSGDITFTGTVTGAGAAFWTAFTGAYASGTTLTVTGVDVTGIFKKGVSLKWLSSADALKVGKVVSSSFSTNTTITIVGSTAEAGDKTFYYGADVMSETFIIPGNQSTGTNVSKSWTAKTGIYPISVDAVVSTAGTTNATTYNLNDDGTTVITTKPSIASTATTDLDNVVDAPTTEIAVNSVVTIDIDAASTTQAIDGYVTLFFIPTWWINRT